MVSNLLNPWGPALTNDFLLSGSASTAVVDLLLSNILYNDTCFNTLYSLQTPSTLNIKVNYVPGELKKVPLTAFTPKKIKTLGRPVSYSLKDAE
jgi:hypothetical protein